jgi:hypothetical protein
VKHKPGAMLALLLGKKKGGDDEEDDGEESTADCEELLGEAFDALREKDREGFIASMKAAIKSEE